MRDLCRSSTERGGYGIEGGDLHNAQCLSWAHCQLLQTLRVRVSDWVSFSRRRLRSRIGPDVRGWREIVNEHG